eukprot:GHVN01050446.1.p1 GENE.GHVN01050446.1~~GHVN01050446.1.p1  ORF type:complete len:912 (+),score=124.55 GHVN01050446.1:619-3354(+)
MSTASLANPSSTSAEVENSSHNVVDLKPSPKETMRLDYTPPQYFIRHVLLSFLLDPVQTVVESDLEVVRNPNSAAGHDLVLMGDGLPPPESLMINEKPIEDSEYQLRCNGDELVIPGSLLPEAADEVFLVAIRLIINPSANLKFMGLYQSNGNYLTQCEAEGFRRITYFLDRPDILSTYNVRIQGPKEEVPVLISNGNKLESGEDGDQHFVFFNDPIPKPCYLFALVAGKYGKMTDSFTTQSGRPVMIEVLSEPGDVKKLEWAMQSIKQAMKWDEDNFGREYDLDTFNIVAAADFNMGAMENKGLNIFNSAVLLTDPKTSTDYDYTKVAGVIAHEYFHNWTGNRVTCRDWFQITLKEGLTVYRDQQFTTSMGGGIGKRIEDVNEIRTRSFAEDSSPMAHPIRPDSYIAIDNFYTVTVYNKGAEVIRMYETILGKEGFRKGTDLYFERHDGQAVTCDDFRKAMAEANGTDLDQFERWYSTKGTPVVKVVGTNYDADKKTFTVELEQQIPHKDSEPQPAPLHIPVKLGLIGKDSKTEILQSTVLHLKTKTHTETYENIEEEPVLSIFRNFSAPIRLAYERPDTDHILLLAHDTDSVVRYDSAQALFENIIRKRADHRIGEKILDMDDFLPQRFVRAIRNVLVDAEGDPTFQALALRLPSELQLMLTMTPADPESIFWARHSVKKQLYSCLRNDFQATYERLTDQLSQCHEYVCNAKWNGIRSLRNLILSYIATAETDESVKTIKEQFDKATNMTDKYPAISLLLHTPDRTEAADALKAFKEESEGNSLMMDKWFACQARSPHRSVVACVEKLKQHPDFNIKNPNRMRSVFSSFSMSPHFHRTDGVGYKIVADAVLQVDTFNDQIASRLCRVLVDWQRYDDVRQRAMKAELQRLLDSTSLSKLTFEVASKGLTL